MADPRYGTNPSSDLLPLQLAPGVSARLLAGKLDDAEEGTPGAANRGPFKTAAEVTMVDFELTRNATVVHSVPRGLHTALVYIYEGSGSVNGKEAGTQTVVQLDAKSPDNRKFELMAGPSGLSAMLFAGVPIGEPIISHGPIVMNTQREIQQCFGELRAGRFPPVRVPWDYKKAAARPKK
jgi:redox-sensitive bicupin YhaK (pirin superfamily)